MSEGCEWTQGYLEEQFARLWGVREGALWKHYLPAPHREALARRWLPRYQYSGLPLWALETVITDLIPPAMATVRPEVLFDRASVLYQQWRWQQRQKEVVT